MTEPKVTIKVDRSQLEELSRGIAEQMKSAGRQTMEEFVSSFMPFSSVIAAAQYSHNHEIRLPATPSPIYPSAGSFYSSIVAPAMEYPSESLRVTKAVKKVASFHIEKRVVHPEHEKIRTRASAIEI